MKKPIDKPRKKNLRDKKLTPREIDREISDDDLRRLKKDKKSYSK